MLTALTTQGAPSLRQAVVPALAACSGRLAAWGRGLRTSAATGVVRCSLGRCRAASADGRHTPAAPPLRRRLLATQRFSLACALCRLPPSAGGEGALPDRLLRGGPEAVSPGRAAALSGIPPLRMSPAACGGPNPVLQLHPRRQPGAQAGDPARAGGPGLAARCWLLPRRRRAPLRALSLRPWPTLCRESYVDQLKDRSGTAEDARVLDQAQSSLGRWARRRRRPPCLHPSSAWQGPPAHPAHAALSVVHAAPRPPRHPACPSMTKDPRAVDQRYADEARSTVVPQGGRERCAALCYPCAAP